MTNRILEVDNLKVAYGRVEAVKGLSLKVETGEFIAVIGSNGAGKSSVMKAIAGVHKPSGGGVVFDGADATGRPSHAMVRAGLALVPEGRQVFGEQSVEDNLLLGGFSRRARGGSAADGLDEAYGLFPRLKERRHQLAGSLSGGEQQMLAIARGLQSQPKLLLIDELSLGLAPKVLDLLFPVLAALNAKGLSILLVEQMATLALSVSNRAYVMENGRVVAEGASRDLARDPRVMTAYLGGHRP
jgi:branched-chain amino acid transport system ATP-binding protein